MAPAPRLAEALGAFSFASDLAFGLRFEDGARSCYLAMRIAERLGLSADERQAVYFTALLKDAGCTCFTSPLAAFWQTNEIVARRELLIFGNPASRGFFINWMSRFVASGLPPQERLRAFARVLRHSNELMEEGFRTACEVSVRLADRIGMSTAVQAAIGALLEQWNGKGFPRGLRGESIPLVARVVGPTFVLAPYHSRGGREGMVDVAAAARGQAFDPTVVDAFLELARDTRFWGEFEQPSIWRTVLDMEPAPHSVLRDQQLDAVAEAVADFADLKLPATAAHSRRTAAMATRLAQRMGLAQSAIQEARRAALMHDVGMVGVPSFVLMRASSERSLAEQEQARLHPYYGQRILSRVPAFHELARSVSAHHERWDGDGFFRGLEGDQAPLTGQLVSLAATVDELTHAIGGRRALSLGQVPAALERDKGAFSPALIRCVREELGGESHAPSRRIEWPAGLTGREVEVLRAAARGTTRAEIAAALVVSEHTVRHHLEHIYQKTGTSTRVGAVLFAMEHDLLP
jgi:HD-GYP domain-containing protein (c-di-GMP phosphodiesterase class II)